MKKVIEKIKENVLGTKLDKEKQLVIFNREMKRAMVACGICLVTGVVLLTMDKSRRISPLAFMLGIYFAYQTCKYYYYYTYGHYVKLVGKVVDVQRTLGVRKKLKSQRVIFSVSMENNERKQYSCIINNRMNVERGMCINVYANIKTPCYEKDGIYVIGETILVEFIYAFDGLGKAVKKEFDENE